MHKLLSQTKELVKKEKHYTYLILCNLKKIEQEKLYCDLGFSSLHNYLEKELHYSSAEAALRVANVKLLMANPIVEKQFENGSLNLTQGENLFQAMNKTQIANKEQKLKEALELIDGKPTRESEKIIQEIFQVKGKSYEKMILSERLKEKIERLKKIYGEKSHEELVEIIVDEKLIEHSIQANKDTHIIKEIEKPCSRYIPISLRRTIILRANKQCEYISQNKNRCNEKRNLEFEHVIPYSHGGGHTLENLKLFCRNHNRRQGILKIKNFSAYKKNLHIKPIR